MRMGGLSTNLNFLIRKIKEDLKIYYKNKLTNYKLYTKLSQKVINFFRKKNTAK